MLKSFFWILEAAFEGIPKSFLIVTGKAIDDDVRMQKAASRSTGQSAGVIILTELNVVYEKI
jgi:hypothetical protein